MSDAIAISAQNLSKAYRIWAAPSARLTSPIWQGLANTVPTRSRLQRSLDAMAKSTFRDFYALRDLSLEVRKGECLGIVGRNGSGKSTLLQLIAGTLQPSHGTVQAHGRVAALLELGSGFNPEFTGRENVFMNASILGLSREQIEARLDDILGFADIGDFVDEPVKIYSSGMALRLAFAVVAHVDADILIVDEAFSVGDARFQLKCARAIDRFVAQGVTLLFVSHDLSSVKRLCRRAILLEQGRLVFTGKANDVVNLYSKLIAQENSVGAIADDIAALNKKYEAASLPPGTTSPDADASPHDALPNPRARLDETPRFRVVAPAPAAPSLAPALSPTDGSAPEAKMESLATDNPPTAPLSGHEFAYGGELGRIAHIEVLDAAGGPRTWFNSGEAVTVRCRFEAYEVFPAPIFALTVKNVSGVEVYGTNTLFSDQPARAMSAGEQREILFSFHLDLMPGHYFLSFGFTHFFGDKMLVIHRRYDAIELNVHAVDRTFGIANLHARITEQRLPETL